MKKTLNYLIPLILLILPTYLIRFKILNIPTTFLEIYIYFVFILFIIERILDRKKIFDKKFILPFIFLILAFFSSFLAKNIDASLGQVKAYFFDGLLVFLMFYSYRNEMSFQKKAFNFYLLAGLFVAFWGLLQKINIAGLINHQTIDPLIGEQLKQGRILGPFESPNYLAMFIAPIIVMLIIVYFRNSEFKYLKKYFWFLMIVLLPALILTQSASAILAVIITLILYFILNSKNKLKWLYATLLLFFIIFSVFSLNKYSSKAGSMVARKEIYQAAITIGKSNQFFGIGLDNFPEYFFRLDIVNRLNYEALHPHNIFLAFWVYMGWPGLIAFLALISICLRRENFYQKPLYYFALIAILINGLTDTTFFKNDLSIIFWYLVAMII